MTLDFGYPWWLSSGHLALAGAGGVLMALSVWRRWPKWLTVVLGVFVLWASLAFLSLRLGLDIASPGKMPTQNFLHSGAGKVLDLGAGTGRSSIMLLTARPQATLVALDLFGDSFDSHFGHGDTPQERLMRNLKIARVDQRASIVTSDMRKVPFEDAAFDGVITAYAIDHLPPDGVKQTLAEAARVLKPGGEFLMIIVNGKDPWLHFAFGPLLAHGGFRGAGWWTDRVAEAPLTVVEKGTAPGSFYLVGRK